MLGYRASGSLVKSRGGDLDSGKPLARERPGDRAAADVAVANKEQACGPSPGGDLPERAPMMAGGEPLLEGAADPSSQPPRLVARHAREHRRGQPRIAPV